MRLKEIRALLFSSLTTNAATLCLVTGSGFLTAHAQNSAADFVSAGTVPNVHATQGAVAGDFKRDGKIDFVVGGQFINGGTDTVVVLNKGRETFDAIEEPHAGDLGAQIGVPALPVDLNGDGTPDLVYISNNSIF